MINVKSIIDVVGALDDNTLAGNCYLYDDNRRGGSLNQGTHKLATAVKKGDQIIWTVTPMECEAYADITAINVPHDICEVKRYTYDGTAIVYWLGTVKEAVDDLPYSITLNVGSHSFSMTCDHGSRLIKGNA
jgi:hypothetical protein